MRPTTEADSPCHTSMGVDAVTVRPEVDRTWNAIAEARS